MGPDGYEGQVFDEIRIAVFQRCEELVAQRSAAELAGLGLRVEVSTAWSLAEPERIRAWVRHAIGGDLPGIRLDDVNLTLRPGLGGPGAVVRFVVDGPSGQDPAGTATALAVVTEPGAAPAVRLDLIYADRMCWRYDLDDEPTWVGVGRGVGDGPVAAVRVPSLVSAVPRGRLLAVRHWRRGVRWRRTEEETRYAILVDGRRLERGETAPARGRGSIEYVGAEDVRTTLAYRLGWRSAA